MGHRKVILVVRHCADGEEHEAHHEHHEHKKHLHSKEFYEKAFSYVHGFNEYISVHGMHFSKKLADYASMHMVNACEIATDGSHPDKPKHSWSADEVEAAFGKIGLPFKEHHKYDYQYVANMAYADFYKKALKEEVDCLKYADAYINDPDGYKEIAFTRWLADVLAKGKEIEWEEMI